MKSNDAFPSVKCADVTCQSDPSGSQPEQQCHLNMNFVGASNHSTHTATGTNCADTTACRYSVSQCMH